MGSRKRFILEAFPANVLVITSKDVDAMCRRNDLEFHELLRPFSGIPYQAPPPAPNRSMTPSTFCLKFVSLAELPRPSVASAQALTNAAVSMGGDLSDIITNSQSSLSDFADTPWFDRYRRAFLDLIRASDHEYFNQPLAIIVAVSSQNDAPIASLIEAFNVEQPPEAFHSIGLSNQMLRSYLLVHDASTGSEKVASETFEKMKVQFGDTACFRLNINSHTPPSPGDVPESIWRDVLPGATKGTETEEGGGMDLDASSQSGAPVPAEVAKHVSAHASGAEPVYDPLSLPPALDPLTQPAPAAPHYETKRVQLGQRLTDHDVLRIRSFVEEYAKHSFLPYFDMIVKQLNQHVSHARKGKGLFATSRRWFGGSTKGNEKEGGPAHTGFAAVYARDSMEAQMRRLADYAFIAQDFELAGTMYQNVRKEYNNDKSWKHQAGALEMLGVTLFLQDDANRTEYYRHFESAIMTYLSKCNAPLYAIRATLLATEMLLARKQYRDAANAYIRMTGEESDLRSALLLEQAAVCFLSMQPTMQRRAAFHLVLAGHRFSKSNHRKHAIRCYLTAMQVYHKCNWGLAEDHIHYTVGRLSLQLGDLRYALQCFSDLIARPDQLASQQKLYLKDFLSTYKELLQAPKSAADDTVELPLPVVQRSSIQVVLRTLDAPHETESSSALAAMAFSEAEWASLEELLSQHLKRQLSGAHSNVLFNDSTNNSVHPVCAVHESVKVRAEIKNPLQVPIEISQLSLFCKRDDQQPQAPDPAAALAGSPAGSPAPAIAYDAERHADVTLEPGEARIIELKVTPREPGRLEIKGMTFSLGGDIKGQRLFRVRGKRLNGTLHQRARIEYGPDNRLRLDVTPPMPQLMASISGFEHSMLAGQLARGIVKLRNTGSTGLVRLVMVCSQPARVYLGTAADLHNMASGDRACESLCSAEARAALTEASVNAVVKVPLKGDTLGAGEEISLPLWLWTDAPGRSGLHFIFYYESVQHVKHMPYRLLRYSAWYDVVPSLRMSATAQIVPQTQERVYLHMSTENTHPTSEITLLRVYCMNKVWEVESMCSGGRNGSAETPTMDIVVSPKETKMMHFFLRRRSTPLSGAHSGPPLSSISLSSGYSAQFSSGSPSSLFFQRNTQKGARWGEDGLRIMLIWCQKNQGIQALAQMHTVARCDPFSLSGAPSSSSTLSALGAAPATASMSASTSTLATVDAGTKATGPQVSIVFKHAPQVVHDFTKSPVLRIPVVAEVAVREVSGELLLEALRGGVPGFRESPVVTKPFLWHGKTKVRLESALVPGSAALGSTSQTTVLRRAELCVCVCEEGVFDLNCARLTLDGAVCVNVNTEPSLLCVLEKRDA